MKIKILSTVFVVLLLWAGIVVMSHVGLTHPRPPMTTERAKSIFSSFVGIPFPNDGSIVGMRDTCGGLINDGEVGIVARIPEPMMQTLVSSPPSTMKTLESSPPSTEGEWIKGPVDDRIATNCYFIYDSPWDRISRREESYARPAELLQLLTDPDILYCAKRGSQDWHHRGWLLILRPSDSTVWVSKWKR